MVRRIGGADRSSTSVLTKVDPPTGWAVRGIDGPIRALVDVDVQPLGADRARLTIDVDFEGHGIGRLLVPLVVRRQAGARDARATSSASRSASRRSLHLRLDLDAASTPHAAPMSTHTTAIEVAGLTKSYADVPSSAAST